MGKNEKNGKTPGQGKQKIQPSAKQPAQAAPLAATSTLQLQAQLLEAVEHENPEKASVIINELQEQNVDPFLALQLLKAIKTGNIELVAAFTAIMQPFNVVDAQGNGALCYAPNFDMLNFLCAFPPNNEAFLSSNNIGDTPLHVAAYSAGQGEPELLNVILEYLNSQSTPEELHSILTAQNAQMLLPHQCIIKGDRFPLLQLAKLYAQNVVGHAIQAEEEQGATVQTEVVTLETLLANQDTCHVRVIGRKGNEQQARCFFSCDAVSRLEGATQDADRMTKQLAGGKITTAGPWGQNGLKSLSSDTFEIKCVANKLRAIGIKLCLDGEKIIFFCRVSFSTKDQNGAISWAQSLATNIANGDTETLQRILATPCPVVCSLVGPRAQIEQLDPSSKGSDSDDEDRGAIVALQTDVAPEATSSVTPTTPPKGGGGGKMKKTKSSNHAQSLPFPTPASPDTLESLKDYHAFCKDCKAENQLLEYLKNIHALVDWDSTEHKDWILKKVDIKEIHTQLQSEKCVETHELYLQFACACGFELTKAIKLSVAFLQEHSPDKLSTIKGQHREALASVEKELEDQRQQQLQRNEMKTEESEARKFLTQSQSKEWGEMYASITRVLRPIKEIATLLQEEPDARRVIALKQTKDFKKIVTLLTVALDMAMAYKRFEQEEIVARGKLEREYCKIIAKTSLDLQSSLSDIESRGVQSLQDLLSLEEEFNGLTAEGISAAISQCLINIDLCEGKCPTIAHHYRVAYGSFLLNDFETTKSHCNWLLSNKQISTAFQAKAHFILGGLCGSTQCNVDSLDEVRTERIEHFKSAWEMAPCSEYAIEYAVMLLEVDTSLAENILRHGMHFTHTPLMEGNLAAALLLQLNNPTESRDRQALISEAEALLHEAINTKQYGSLPKDDQAFLQFKLGQASMLKGEPTEAEQCIERALVLAPEYCVSTGFKTMAEFSTEGEWLVNDVMNRILVEEIITCVDDVNARGVSGEFMFIGTIIELLATNIASMPISPTTLLRLNCHILPNGGVEQQFTLSMSKDKLTKFASDWILEGILEIAEKESPTEEEQLSGEDAAPPPDEDGEGQVSKQNDGKSGDTAHELDRHNQTYDPTIFALLKEQGEDIESNEMFRFEEDTKADIESKDAYKQEREKSLEEMLEEIEDQAPVKLLAPPIDFTDDPSEKERFYISPKEEEVPKLPEESVHVIAIMAIGLLSYELSSSH